MPAFLLLFIPCFLRLFFLHGTAVYNLLCKNRSSNISTQLCVILCCVLFLETIFKATQPEITLRAGTCQIMLLCSTDFTKYFITPQSALCAQSDVEFVVVNVMKVKELLLFWTIFSTTAFSVSPTCIFIIMNKDNRNRTWKCCFSFCIAKAYHGMNHEHTARNKMENVSRPSYRHNNVFDDNWIKSYKK